MITTKSTEQLTLIIERSLAPLNLPADVMAERVAHLLGELSTAVEPKGKDADLPVFAADHQMVVINTTDTPDEDGYIGPHSMVWSVDAAEAVTSNSRIPNKAAAPPWYWRWNAAEDQFPASFMHRPMLDIDFPAALIPSSTPGHFHLYLDKLMTWENYKKLIETLGEVGILEPGYVGASSQRCYTSLRLPWVKKGRKDDLAEAS